MNGPATSGECDAPPRARVSRCRRRSVSAVDGRQRAGIDGELGDGVVSREAAQALTEGGPLVPEVGATVADVRHPESVALDEGSDDGRAHPGAFGVLERVGLDGGVRGEAAPLEVARGVLGAGGHLEGANHEGGRDLARGLPPMPSANEHGAVPSSRASTASSFVSRRRPRSVRARTFTRQGGNGRVSPHPIDDSHPPSVNAIAPPDGSLHSRDRVEHYRVAVLDHPWTSVRNSGKRLRRSHDSRDGVGESHAGRPPSGAS